MSTNPPDDSKQRQCFVLLSPLAILAVGHLTARFAGATLGVWVWIPLNLVLWAMFAFFIAWGGGGGALRRWLGPARGAWGWKVLAIAVGLIPLPLMLLHWKLFDSAWLVLAWLIFAIVNAPLEEAYWRGLLLDRTARWPGWLGVLYSSVFFALNHPLTIGVHSIANRHPATAASTFVMGLVWAVVYRKTGSLRWAIASHVLVDLLNLSVLAFLNRYVPPGIPGR